MHGYTYTYIYIPYIENYMHTYVCVKNARLRVLTIYMCKLLTCIDLTPQSFCIHVPYT